jgi:carbon storage regulator
MLILSRKVGERIRIADHIKLVVTAIESGRIKIGIEAPKTVQALRAELASHPRNLGERCD